MKVAVLHAGDMESLALGGVDQYIKNIIRERGSNDIYIYGTCVYGKYVLGKKYKMERDSLSYTFIPISDNRRYPLTFFYMIHELRYLKDICRNDIIFSQRIELTLPFLFCKDAKKKLVQIIHGSSCYTTLHWKKWKRRLYEMAERLSVQIAKRTYVVLMRNEFGVPYYRRKYKRYQSKIQYAKIPVDTEIFFHQNKKKCREELGLPQDAFIIMYGGRIEHSPKRVFLFPEILKRLLSEGKDVFCVIVGSGSDFNELEIKFAGAVPKERYEMIGYLENRALLAKYINACDININLSEFEGTCTSSMEAIACGVPVLSTDVGDIRLLIFEHKNGCIIENSSDEQLVADSVAKITEIMKTNIDMTNDYMRYDYHTVIKELFGEFQEII